MKIYTWPIYINNINPQNKSVYKLQIEVVVSDSAPINMTKLAYSYMLFLIVVIAGLSIRFSQCLCLKLFFLNTCMSKFIIDSLYYQTKRSILIESISRWYYQCRYYSII